MTPTIKQIQQATADYYGIHIDAILGPSRQRRYCQPRHMAAKICKEWLNPSWEDMAWHFGRRHHTTMMSGVKSIEEQLRRCPQLRQDRSEIERNLDANERSMMFRSRRAERCLTFTSRRKPVYNGTRLA